MSYELDLLTRLVSGELSPASFNLSATTLHCDFLRHRFGTHLRHFKVQYHNPPAGEATYQHHDEFAFLELDALPRLPPAGPVSTEPRTLSLLLADALPRFGLTLPQLRETGCQQVGDQFFLELTVTCSFDHLPAAKSRYFYYHTQLLDETARLRCLVPSQVIQHPDAAAAAGFVQHFQRAVQGLLTHAYAQLDPAQRAGCYGRARDYSLPDIHQLIYVELEKLLAHVEHTFPEYLNLAAPLSYRRRIQALTDVQLPLAAVLLALHSAEGIPPRLLALVRDCLSRLLITVQDSSLSYQDILYPRLLLRELHGRLQNGWPLTTQNLGCLLLRFNFNTHSYFSLVTAHLRAEAAAAGDHPAERLPVVLLHLKLYRQLQPATELRYAPALLPLRTQVISWLKEERDYLTSQVQAAPAPAPSPPARILTPLSVAQMALLLRTLHDAGIFGQANQRDLFRLLAANFRTARQEQISEKSLADKYYNAEDNTRQAVEKIVEKMLDSLR